MCLHVLPSFPVLVRCGSAAASARCNEAGALTFCTPSCLTRNLILLVASFLWWAGLCGDTAGAGPRQLRCCRCWCSTLFLPCYHRLCMRCGCKLAMGVVAGSRLRMELHLFFPRIHLNFSYGAGPPAAAQFAAAPPRLAHERPPVGVAPLSWERMLVAPVTFVSVLCDNTVSGWLLAAAECPWMRWLHTLKPFVVKRLAVPRWRTRVVQGGLSPRQLTGSIMLWSYCGGCHLHALT